MAVQKALNRFAVDENGWLARAEKACWNADTMLSFVLCDIVKYIDIDQQIIQNKPLKKMP